MSATQLKKSHQKLLKAINKCFDQSIDLAADALAVKPAICAELGAVGKRLQESINLLEDIERKHLQ